MMMSEEKLNCKNSNSARKFVYRKASGCDEEEWELTWPIWHMLSRSERKSIALRNGMNTIGEFEEYMALHKAEEISSSRTNKMSPYSNELMYDNTSINKYNKSKLEGFNQSEELKDVEHSSDDEDGEYLCSDDYKKLMYNKDDEIKKKGLILLLNEDLYHRIMSFLDLDYYYITSLVHPYWSSYTLNEQAYKIMCSRCYLNQSKKKVLNIANFRNSYKIMLTIRPRVKTGCGVYILKCSSIKRIQRDMFTEIPFGAVLESIYYRYFFFFENGKVLYALTTAHPAEMIPRLRRVRSTFQKDGDVVWGTYEVSKYNVQVSVRHEWCHVIMDLKILKGVQVGFDGVKGRFRVLLFDKHCMSVSGDFSQWSRDLVNLDCNSTHSFFYYKKIFQSR